MHHGGTVHVLVISAMSEERRRAFVSHAILLTLNQGLTKSMDALKTEFHRKVFAAALTEGAVRL